MARRKKKNRLFHDIKEQVVDGAALMKQRAVDLAPMHPDTRLSAFVGAAAISVPVVTVVASDHHVRMAKPNRKQAEPEMKHHRVSR